MFHSSKLAMHERHVDMCINVVFKFSINPTTMEQEMEQPTKTTLAKFTPGPWTVKRIASCYATYALKEATERAHGLESAGAASFEEVDANARLIAAAPDILDELQRAHAIHHRAAEHGLRCRPSAEHEMAKALAEVHDGEGSTRYHERAAVIAKALGAAS